MKLTLVDNADGLFDCFPEYTLFVEQEATPIDYVVMFRYDTPTYGQNPALHQNNTLKFRIPVTYKLYDELFDKYGDHNEVLQHISNTRKMYYVRENPVAHRRDMILFKVVPNLQGGSLKSADVVYLESFPQSLARPMVPTIYVISEDKTNGGVIPILLISCDNYSDSFATTHDMLDELIQELKTPTYYEYDYDRA
jgi:hypothetical protein